MSQRADYGFDAPAVPVGLAVGAAVSLAATVVIGLRWGWWAFIPLAYALFFGFSLVSFVYTTRRGKFVVWEGLLQLDGGERVVDLGCGRGAVLTLVARRGGRAIGVDLWRSVDQSGNDPSRTRANAAAEGVAVELITGDMRALPFATGSVDVVVSSLAIHNIPDHAGRARAIAEAARILRPGGRLIIADFRHVRAYGELLVGLGLSGVTIRDLGWRFWYGGPWARTGVVIANVDA
ncbi:class I SAM-dependent methyltransferase [Actinoplanes bogorensis]|uniref:Class I SAM-dependent methyltransferase n=1 Tax=Paractinoplanes bogorensis TaxID=1610840 RepID=A0ABS5YTY1_9ACTN|nr:class I SAM-dependent methyltransferase [Actinoplanes bogorensis]MBU2666781.1 class I SAM-dependent methyltransferase [Actinoplanes bogorensis]